MLLMMLFILNLSLLLDDCSSVTLVNLHDIQSNKDNNRCNVTRRTNYLNDTVGHQRVQ